MRTMSERDYKVFEQFVKMSQPNLKKVMTRWLREKYSKVVETKEYIYAIGDIPIALAAHMDTVFTRPVELLLYDTKKNIMTSPDGLGADDRAGIFAIYKLIQQGLRPHVILSTDEEIGCIGATALSKLECPFENLKYIIQLDRRGTNDCVFYDCDNPDFVQYVEQFGFTEAIGSFTDITEYCPAWGVAGVNLSVGYMNEHSASEILYVNALYSTIDKVANMLSEEDIPFFKYIPYVYTYDTKGFWGNGAWSNNIKTYKYDSSYKISLCARCGEDEFEEDMFPVLMLDGTKRLMCANCIADRDIVWCTTCYGAAIKASNSTVEDKNFVCAECQLKQKEEKK